MSDVTPRQQLELRVRLKFLELGYSDHLSADMATRAVDEFYDENQSGTHFALVAAESYQIIIDVIPPFASNILAAFQGLQSAITTMADSIHPYTEMANKAKIALPEPGPDPQYNPTGLPMTDGPFLVGANAEASSVYSDTPPPAQEENAGRPLRVNSDPNFDGASSARVTQNRWQTVADGTLDWGPGTPPVDALLDVPGDTGRRLYPAIPGDNEPRTGSGVLSEDDVIEVTAREFHLAVARRLRQLGCTYGELEQMHRRNGGDFETAQHHSAWFAFGGMVNLEQLDRANFVLDNLARGDAFGVEMDDAAIERAEATYPDDRLTGAPHHFLVNGDHSACGCGGHLVECTTYADPTCSHAASICGINRTLCEHQPRHKYREPCSNDPHTGPTGYDMRRFRSESVGLTTEGEPVYGPAADQ